MSSRFLTYWERQIYLSIFWFNYLLEFYANALFIRPISGKHLLGLFFTSGFFIGLKATLFALSIPKVILVTLLIKIYINNKDVYCLIKMCIISLISKVVLKIRWIKLLTCNWWDL